MTASKEAPAFVIDMAQSKAFARLSGDFNPLHVNEVDARRLQFGHTVCHGVNLVLRAMDTVAQAVGLNQRSNMSIMSVAVVFHQPVLTGTAVHLRVQHDPAAKRIKLAGLVGGRTTFVLQMVLGAPTNDTPLPTLDAEPESACLPDAPQFPGTGNARHALASNLPLRVNAALFQALFPALADWPEALGMAAELMATTRIVGMRCPGLHSIYSEFKLRRRASPTQRAALNYEVTLADPRFQKIKIALSGALLEGTLDAFFRAPPVKQRTLVQVQALTRPGCTAGQKALVVGGSRGLGELVAKMLLAGGAEVTITYARGLADAESTRHEASALGARCTVLQVDASAPLTPDVIAAVASVGYTHLYHFATPAISKSAAGHWSQALFESYCRVYVGGLAELAHAATAAQGRATPLRVFYPSTVFLDAAEKGFAEYSAAKAAGETLCLHLTLDAARFAVQHPRLPRMKTDQNSSFLGAEADDPYPTMARALQNFCGWQAAL